MAIREKKNWAPHPAFDGHQSHWNRQGSIDYL